MSAGFKAWMAFCVTLGIALFALAARRRRLASGGTVLSWEPTDDEIPAILAPGRSTALRPGETHLEAMERLMEGEDGVHFFDHPDER